MGGARPHRRDLEVDGGGRDAHHSVGQADRRDQDPRRRAARHHGELQHRRAMGEGRGVLRTREERPDLLGRAHRRGLAVHRQPRRHPRHLRNLHAYRGETVRRRPCRPLRADRRARRHGRLAAARRPHGQGGDPLRRGRSRARREAQGDRLPRRYRAGPRCGARDDRKRQGRKGGAVGRRHRQRGRNLSRDFSPRRHSRCRHRSDRGPRPRLRLCAEGLFARGSARAAERPIRRG